MATNVESYIHLPVDVGPTHAPKTREAADTFREHLVERKPVSHSTNQRDSKTDEPAASRENEPTDTIVDDEQPDESNVLKDESNQRDVVDDSPRELDSTSGLLDEESYFYIDQGGIPAIDEPPPSNTEESGLTGEDALTEVEEETVPEVPNADSKLQVETVEANDSRIARDSNVEVLPRNSGTNLSNSDPQATPPTTPQNAEVSEMIPRAAENNAESLEQSNQYTVKGEASEPADKLVTVAAEPIQETPNSERKPETQTEIKQFVGPANDTKHPPAGNDASEGKQKRTRQVGKSTTSEKSDDPTAKVPRVEHANRLLQETAAIQTEPSSDELSEQRPARSAPATNDAEQAPAKQTATSADNLNATTGKPNSGEQRLAALLGGSRRAETQSNQPLSDAQQARLVQRVAKAFDAARTRGESIVRLRLSPPELGSLRLEVQVESGSLIAKVEVETQVARDAVLDNLNALRQRLAEQNIRVDQFDVDLLDRRASDSREQGDQQSRERSPEGQQQTRQNEKRGADSPQISAQRVVSLLDAGVIDVTV